MDMNLHCVTWSAPTNIAVIKYWGKDDTNLNTPLNSSVSVTLSQDELNTKTSIAASTSFEKDRLWLNGLEQDINSNKRIQTVLREMRKLASDAQHAEGTIRKEDWTQYRLHIVSENNFPTAAGLASSASGYACLVAALVDLFNAKEEFEGHFSTIARQGSGSACRSLYGGFVRWHKGERKDGMDSKAIQIADELHWPDLEVLICVVSDQQKDISSTSGMSTSKETSEFLTYRAKNVVPDRLASIEDAYKEKDFERFGRITMQDSNQFHATCLDTFPPIFYMNDTSRSIIHIVQKYNESKGAIKAAYTFDAGPNAVIYAEKKYAQELLGILCHFFQKPDVQDDEFLVGRSKLADVLAARTEDSLIGTIKVQPSIGNVKKIYHTKVGKGVQKLSAGAHLLDLRTGVPLKTNTPS